MSTGIAARSGNGEWRAGERRRRRRILCLCIAASCAVHLAALFTVTPPWAGRAARVKPAGRKAVSLRLKPRPAGGVAKAPAAAKPPAAVTAAAKPAEKAPMRAPVYGREELARALSKVLAPLPEEAAKTKETRLMEMLTDRESSARNWVAGEARAVSAEEERAEEGAVGYERVIDLRRCSDFEIGRLMDRFKMEVGYGSRKVSDFNLRFTSQWLLTPGQYKNLLSRAGGRTRGGRAAPLPSGAAVVALEEPADGPPRAYLSPTVAAVASIIEAEEEYFSSSKADPERLGRVVFRPVWSHTGPAFTVASAEAKRQAEETKTPAAGDAAAEKGKGVTR